MKRLLILLMLCLLPMQALAFDLSAYEIPDSAGCTATPLGQNRLLLRFFSTEAGRPGLIRLTEEGAILQEIALPAASDPSTSYIAFVHEDLRLGVIACQRSHAYANQNSGYTLYDVQSGQLTNARSLPGEITNLIRFDGCFIGLKESDTQPAEFMLYDRAMQIRLHGQLPYARVEPLYSSMDSSDLLLMLRCWDENHQQVLITRIAPDNRVCWQLWLPWSPIGSYSMVMPDGQGGAFLIASPEEDYKQKRLAHVSAAGQLEWEKTLSSPDRVLMLHAAIPQADGTTALYGTAVARSRGIYDAFAAFVAPDGTLLSTDIRDFSARADYAFTCKRAPDGVIYAVSEREQRNCAVVPFADLPPSPGSSLIFR